MKKVLFAVFCIALLCLTAVAVYADEGPIITLQPQNPHFDGNGYVTFTVEAKGNNLHSTWYLEYDGVLSDVYNGRDNNVWRNYVDTIVAEEVKDLGNGRYSFTMTFKTVSQELSGARVYCVVEDGHYDVRSDYGIVTIGADGEPPVIKVPSYVNVYVNEGRVECALPAAFEDSPIRQELYPHVTDDKLILSAIVTSGSENEQLDFVWYETPTGQLPEIKALLSEEEFANFIDLDISESGTRYYVLMAAGTKGGMSYSSVIPVTVYGPETVVEDVIVDTYIPAAVVGQPYRHVLECTDKQAMFSAAYNPGGKNQLSEAGLTISEEGVITGVPEKVGTYEFTICAACRNNEAYRTFTFYVNPNEPEYQGSETVIGETETAPVESETEAPAESETEAPESDAPDSVLETSDQETEKTPEDTKKDGGDDGEEKKDNTVLIAVIVGVVAAGLGAGVAVIATKAKKKAE